MPGCQFAPTSLVSLPRHRLSIWSEMCGQFAPKYAMPMLEIDTKIMNSIESMQYLNALEKGE